MREETAAEFAILESQLGELQSDAQQAGAAAIEAELRALESEYPRHRFSFMDSMGLQVLRVEPDILGNDSFAVCDVERLCNWYGPCSGKIAQFGRRVNDVLTTAEKFIETFHVSLGDVKLTRP